MEEITRFRVMYPPDQLVEDGIRPLVSALNETGLIRTFGSCEGHVGKKAPMPYVDFHADRRVAGSIGRLLVALDPNSGSPFALRNGWELQGRLAAGFERWRSFLCWRMALTQRKTREPGFRRDLATLTRIVPEVVLQVGSSGRPVSLFDLLQRFSAVNLQGSELASGDPADDAGLVELPGDVERDCERLPGSAGDEAVG